MPRPPKKEKDKLDAKWQGSSSGKKNDSVSDEIEDLLVTFIQQLPIL